MAPTTRSFSARMVSQTTWPQAGNRGQGDSEWRPTKKRKRHDSDLDASIEPQSVYHGGLNASYLPEDILNLIFQCLYHDRRSIPQSSHSGSCKTWIYVSHVCRRWRNIALNCTPLWCNITSTRTLEEMETYIARSKTAPIRTQLSQSEPLAVQKLILQQLPRTRSLTIVCNTDRLEKDESLSPFWDLPTPCLEALIFYSLDFYPHPPSILQRPHPALRTIWLARVHTQWDSPALTNLVALSLAWIMDTYQPTMSELYLILLACPNLKSLALINAGPKEARHFQVTHWNSPIIHLHHLLDLSVDMNTDDWAVLLQYLNLPATTTWGIICRDMSWADPPTIIPRQMSIESSAITIVANSSATVIAQQNVDLGKESERQIRMHLSEDTGDVAYVFNLVPSVINGTSLVNITSLYMQFIAHEDDWVERPLIEEWAHFLGTLPKLEVMTISLAECSHVDVGMALFEVLANERTAEDSEAYAAPKLRKLELHGSDPTHHVPLAHCLKARYKFAPLQELVLAGCGQLGKTYLKTLRKHVGELRVMAQPREVPLPQLAEEL